MTNNATWPIELGTTGVLGAGRWLWLRAILWAVMYRGSPPWQSSSGAGSSLGCFTWQPGGFGCPLACTRHGTSSKISCSE
jgi:hypothetical protein